MPLFRGGGNLKGSGLISNFLKSLLLVWYWNFRTGNYKHECQCNYQILETFWMDGNSGLWNVIFVGLHTLHRSSVTV